MPPPFVLKKAKSLVNITGSKWMVTEIKDQKEKEVINFFKERMKIDAGFIPEPDGIYTWIIKSGHLVTMPVTSAQEVGAVHVNMWSWTPEFGTFPQDVSAAGELEKKGATVKFNLKSGTFMKLMLRRVSIAAVDALAAKVAAKFDSLGITATFLRCNPCKEDYETKSGTAIVDNAEIVTSRLEMFFLNQLFKMESSDLMTNSNWYELIEGIGEEHSGGTRRRRRRSKKSRKQKRKSV